MRVHIIGPNLLDQSKGSFHVHAEGCADVKRNREYQLPEFASDRANAVEVASQLDAAEYVYSDQIADDEMTAADGVNDLWFAPCTAELPYSAESEPEKVVVDFDLEHDGDYHRVQIDGSDLISIEDNGDGTAHVTVYDSSAEKADVAWSGVVRIDGHFTKLPWPDDALPKGTFVKTTDHGFLGRITKVHDGCPEGAAWRMGQSIPLTGIYAEGGGTWYSVLVHNGGSVVAPKDKVETIEPFDFVNPWADEYFGS